MVCVCAEKEVGVGDYNQVYNIYFYLKVIIHNKRLFIFTFVIVRKGFCLLFKNTVMF